MKKLKSILTAIAGLTFGLSLFNCGGSIPAEVTPGTIGEPDPALIAAAASAKSVDPNNSKVLFYYWRNDSSYSKWGLWIWEPTTNNGEPTYNATAGKATVVTENGIKLAYWDLTTLTKNIPEIKECIDESKDLGFLVRDGGWTKDVGTDRTVPLSGGSKHFMVITGDSAVYDISGSFEPTIVSASSVTSNTVLVSLSTTFALTTAAGANEFSVFDAAGNEFAVIDAINNDSPSDRSKNNAKNVLLTINGKLLPGTTYFVKHARFVPANGCEISMTGAVKSAAAYDGNDLGLTLDGNKATFKSWSPLATSVDLLLYASVNDIGNFNAKSVSAKSVGSLDDEELLGTPATVVPMVKDPSNNVWTAIVDDVTPYTYYKYKIVNSGKTTYVSDIWGYSASADAIASQIIDINSASEAIPSSTTDTAYGTKEAYYNPFGKSGSETKAYTDAVIYEMHVTDWSFAETESGKAVKDYSNTNVGKYLTIANGDKVIAHIKELGVTHVQILPVFEFAETNANKNYNWGYNPYHYNVPEGRYVTEGYTDGSQAVLELRTLIAKFHEAGIAVNMDVVYNHTNGIQGGSLYDSTVPAYFYRIDATGAYSNGSGCGNEIDSEATMAKKYIIDSLKHWMLDYHFNGFRFDLMGCLSKETMADIYAELHEIDPNVMVYGEPWTGGTALVVNGADQAVSSSVGYGAGAFDDDFRDAVKGAEFGGFKRGQVQDANSDTEICTGLVGNSGKNKRNDTGVLGLRLNYDECHDNYTLFDKLAICEWQTEKGKTTVTSGDLFSLISADGLELVKKEDKLAAAYIFLAQGTAFMNGGQEFLRTKRGNENSYNASNTSKLTTNGIDLEFKETYNDVYLTYKGLIALRQSDTATFGGNKNASVSKIKTGVTKYITGDYCVYYNASTADEAISSTGYSKMVDVTTGTPTESTTLPSSVSAKGFVILKK